jgi:hypothetical protein
MQYPVVSLLQPEAKNPGPSLSGLSVLDWHQVDQEPARPLA